MTRTDEVEPWIELARKHGLTSFRLNTAAGDVEFTLGPAPVPSSSASGDAKSAVVPTLVPKCSCNHPKYDHRADIGCIHGCPPHRCIPNPPEVKE